MDDDGLIGARPPLTKIVATIGPASSSAEVITRLIETGVSVFRLNFGHGTLEDRSNRVTAIREAAESLGRPIAIMGDLQGPKIRVGSIEGDGVDVQPGQTVVFQRQPITGKAKDEPLRLSCTYSGLVNDVQPGQRVLIADGAVRLLVVDKKPDELVCTVSPNGGGHIGSRKGINLPDTALRIDAMTDADRKDVEWSIEHGVDFLALSFVRMTEDINRLRSELKQSPIHIIAKIERPEAVQNIDAILDASDAIMVARGDLGVEMDLARVPVIQKQLIAAAESHGKPCIVATQMLESMIESPIPTRAEASDVAGAILDGADALMLSGETAVGAYPVITVENMRRIALHTEAYIRSQPAVPNPPRRLIESGYRTAALAHGAWHIAQDIAAKFIVVWSQRGGGARYLSQNDFNVPILACTSDDRAARQMQLLRGVTPIRMPTPEGLHHFTQLVDAYLMETGWANDGDVCLMMAGAPIGTQGVTNCLAVHTVGDPATGFGRS